jgi:hypothetical protein
MEQKRDRDEASWSESLIENCKGMGRQGRQVSDGFRPTVLNIDYQRMVSRGDYRLSEVPPLPQ